MFKRKVRARVCGDKNWLSSKDLDRAVAASERDDKKAARRFKRRQLEQDLELARRFKRRIKTARPKKEKASQQRPKGARLIQPGRRSVLPNYGFVIRDRLGRIGVHPKFKYIASKTSKPGAAKRAVRYYLRGAAIDANGKLMAHSNVALSPQEAAALFDHMEMINRSAQKNAKVATTGILPMDPRWTPQQMMKVAKGWADESLGQYGLPYFLALHPPPPEGDQRNWHVHIIWSWRPVTRVGDYEWEVSENLLTSLDGPAGIRRLRERYAAHMTTMSAEVGDFDVYTSLSHAARGLPIIPQKPLYETRTRKARAGEFVPENERNHERMIASLEALLDDELRAFGDYLAAKADALQKAMASFIRPVRVPDVPVAAPAPSVTMPEEFMDVVEPLRPINEQAADISVPEPGRGFSLAELQRMFAGLFGPEIPEPLETATVPDPLPDCPEAQSASTVVSVKVPNIPPLLRTTDPPELPDLPSEPAPSASASVANLRIPALDPLTPIDASQIPDVPTPPPPQAVTAVGVPDGVILQPLKPIAVPTIPPGVPPPIIHPVPVVPPVGQLPQSLPTIAPAALPGVPPSLQPAPSIVTGKLPRTSVLDRIGARTLALLDAAIAEADSLLRRIIDRAKAAEEDVEREAEDPVRPPDPVVAPVTPVMAPESDPEDDYEHPSDGELFLAHFNAPDLIIQRLGAGFFTPHDSYLKRYKLAPEDFGGEPLQAELADRFRKQEEHCEEIAALMAGHFSHRDLNARLVTIAADMPPKYHPVLNAWNDTPIVRELWAQAQKLGQNATREAVDKWQSTPKELDARYNSALAAAKQMLRWPIPLNRHDNEELAKDAVQGKARAIRQTAASDSASGDTATHGLARVQATPEEASARRPTPPSQSQKAPDNRGPLDDILDAEFDAEFAHLEAKALRTPGFADANRDGARTNAAATLVDRYGVSPQAAEFILSLVPLLCRKVDSKALKEGDDAVIDKVEADKRDRLRKALADEKMRKLWRLLLARLEDAGKRHSERLREKWSEVDRDRAANRDRVAWLARQACQSWPDGAASPSDRRMLDQADARDEWLKERQQKNAQQQNGYGHGW